jgi:hypothetical protein
MLLTSFVSLITREGVLKRSVLENENPWIFPNSPRRISLPNPILAMEEKREETAPQTSASIAYIFSRNADINNVGHQKRYADFYQDLDYNQQGRYKCRVCILAHIGRKTLDHLLLLLMLLRLLAIIVFIPDCLITLSA